MQHLFVESFLVVGLLPTWPRRTRIQNKGRISSDLVFYKVPSCWWWQPHSNGSWPQTQVCHAAVLCKIYKLLQGWWTVDDELID